MFYFCNYLPMVLAEHPQIQFHIYYDEQHAPLGLTTRRCPNTAFFFFILDNTSAIHHRNNSVWEVCLFFISLEMPLGLILYLLTFICKPQCSKYPNTFGAVCAYVSRGFRINTSECSPFSSSRSLYLEDQDVFWLF